jgi:Domain of unknown function (DUF5979)/Fibronectin type III domain
VASPSSTRSRRSFWAAIVAALTLGSSLLLAGVSTPSVLAGSKGDAVGPVEVTSAVYSDVSAPVRDLVGVAPAPSTDKEKKEKPLRVLPNKGNALNQADGALQTTSGPLVGTTNGLNFAGVGAGDYLWISDQWAPPDTNGAVGQTQYVQWVNTSFAVFDKATGAILSGFPKPGNSIWAGFAGGGGGCQTNNDGDPIVQYDKLANRWILTQFSVSTTPYLQCIAVSTTSDATGTYNRYAFTEPYFNDYPKLGVWPDGYYLTFNMFNGNSFAGARACALDRTKMLTGDPAATQQCFQLSPSYGGLLPSDLDGTTPPPDGSPEFFLNFVNAFNGNSLNLWKFHVDFTTPANSTFSGPSTIPVAAFSTACSGGGSCIPQPGTTNRLASLADRLMYRLAYRNFGDHEALVVNHSVTVSGVTSVRWYEIRSPNGTPGVFQQGTLGTSDGISRWMGSIAMDRSGNIALGYSASSGSVYPSIRYTGRLATDAPGQMQTENTIQLGTGSQTGTLQRWGDYSAMSVDPVDDCTFWYTNEYLKNNGTWNWSTRIASFKFPGCGSSATPGSLVLAKVLTGGSYTGPFTIHYICGSTSGDAPVYAGASTTISGIPANTSCTVSEPTLPTAPTGYAFGTPTFSPSATASVPAGGSVTVTTNNTLNAPGSLVLAKVLTGGSYTGPFTIHYICGSTSGDAPVYAGASTTISGIPANTSCTVSEPTLPTAPTGYAFGTPTFSPSATASVPAGGSVTVTTNNTLNATPGVPGAPQYLTAVSANGKGVQLAWQTPSSSGSSPISGYNVYRGPGTNPSSLGLVSTLGVVTSYKDVSTARGSTYTYYVMAVNAAGPSLPSNTATAIAR